MPCGDSTPPPTPWRDPRGFSAIPEALRPPPSRPPLRGNPVPLRRPRGPRCRPSLPRFCRTFFPSCLLISPFAPALPHGGPVLLPPRRPRRGLSRCCPRRPSFPLIAAPRRLLGFPTPSPSASLFTTPSPLRLLSPHLSPIPPFPQSPLRPTPQYLCRSPPGRPPLPCIRSTPPSWVPHTVAVRVSLSHPAPPCGRRLLLCHRSLRFLPVRTAPLRAFVVDPRLSRPPCTVLCPFVVTAYLVPVILAPFSARLLLRHPCPRL